MIINPSEQTVKENYKLLIGSILPRPIAFVSTVSEKGVFNLAPYSFFTAITSKPPHICFAPSIKKGGHKKDTLNNIEKTKEFVVNIVSYSFIEKVNEAATEFPEDYDEFKETGLTSVKSQIVKAPRLKESYINMECKLNQIVYLGPQEPGGGALVIGEVVLFHVSDEIIKNGRIDTSLLDPVGRLAGQEYSKLGKRFTLLRKLYKNK